MARPLVAIDLGGVVVDVRPLAVDGIAAAQVEHAFFGHQDGGLTEHAQVSLGLLPAELWLERVAKRLQRSPAELENAWRQRISIDEGAADLLRVLADADTVVWSNTDPIHFQQVATWLPAAMTNDATRSLSCEIGQLKPAPDFFEKALARLHRRPTMFLDDRPENVNAARAAGIEAALVKGATQALHQVRRLFADAL